MRPEQLGTPTAAVGVILALPEIPVLAMAPVAFSNISRVLRLTLLSPNFREAILQGTHWPEETPAKVLEAFPMDQANRADHLGKRPKADVREGVALPRSIRVSCRSY